MNTKSRMTDVPEAHEGPWWQCLDGCMMYGHEEDDFSKENPWLCRECAGEDGE